MDQARILPVTKLNVAAISTGTRALGPGLRAVVWVQGCPLNCKGCLAPDWIPFREANMMTIEEILAKLDIRILDGITFSGGEPMEQAEALAELTEAIRAIKDLTVVCFTGYRYEYLLANPPNPGVEKLLTKLDVLIDGPYIQSRNDSTGLRGSSNQRIIHLTDRLKNHPLESQKRIVEISITNGELAFIGIPTPDVKSALDIASLSGFERIRHNERI